MAKPVPGTSGSHRSKRAASGRYVTSPQSDDANSRRERTARALDAAGDAIARLRRVKF
jgi:hypothetical protein